ncbi:hypothetical protein XIS1_890108 [Xenorhabdus innexi]|uniref:Uncharacterized protein n=1 Tax=Xenorhabdus innexi TaxID=290109 RepID=A0A1N6N1L4_9GAMM|nr:hypothetical protein Xinn_01318 [Xenorhabdus innexi]SIP74960.1 hypothetical protein XIS1_890108 [Xenorhabdus innexi]
MSSEYLDKVLIAGYSGIGQEMNIHALALLLHCVLCFEN